MNETYHSILICSVPFHLIPHSFPFYSTIAHSIPDISIPFHYYFLGLVNRIHDYYKIFLLTAWENAQQRRVRHEDPHGMPAVRLGGNSCAAKVLLSPQWFAVGGRDLDWGSAQMDPLTRHPCPPTPLTHRGNGPLCPHSPRQLMDEQLVDVAGSFRFLAQKLCLIIVIRLGCRRPRCRCRLIQAQSKSEVKK